MNKRLRKKHHIGEFADYSFMLTGKLAEMDAEAEDRFYGRILQLAEECRCWFDGVFKPDSFDLEVITGPAHCLNEERRAALLEGLKEIAEITEFNAGELAKR